MSVLPPINDLTDDECGDNASKKKAVPKAKSQVSNKTQQAKGKAKLKAKSAKPAEKAPKPATAPKAVAIIGVYRMFTCVPGILCGHTNEEACGEREGRHQDQQPTVPQGLQRMDLEEWLQASDCRALLVFVFSTSDKYLLCV